MVYSDQKIFMSMQSSASKLTRIWKTSRSEPQLLILLATDTTKEPTQAQMQVQGLLADSLIAINIQPILYIAISFLLYLIL